MPGATRIFEPAARGFVAFLERHLPRNRQRLFAGGLVFASALLLVGWPLPESGEKYPPGKVQPTTVIAEFEFPILKDVDVLEEEQAERASEVPAVVAQNDSARTVAQLRARALHDKVKVLRRRSHRDADRLEVDLELGQSTLIALLLGAQHQALLEVSEALAADVMRRGYVGTEQASLLARYGSVRVRDPLGDVIFPTEQLLTADRVRELALRRADVSDLAPEVVAELTLYLAVPNLELQADATRSQVEEAIGSVDPAAGIVLSGEKIIDAHERITPERYRVLRSYEYWRGKRGLTASVFRRLLPSFGDLVLVLVLLSAFYLYLRAHQPLLLERPEDFWLLAGIQSIVLILAAVLIKGFGLPAVLVPVAAVSILTTLFFDDRVGMAATVLPVFLVGLVADGGTPFFAVVGLGSVGAVLLTPRVRRRKQFYWLLVSVPLVHLVVLFALFLAEGTPLSSFIRNGLAAAGSPFLAIAVAFFCVPILESIFHRATDLSLLELGDQNRPLLRRLLLEAPGTYHHSIQVGALADAGALATGANPLLARVIGYYHDVGKLTKPEYFPENVPIGRKNPHDKLNPSMSRIILESHLREGVTLAEESRLPREVVQGIREHHGVTLMASYYHKAREKDETARPEEFSYPGPIPSSKEAALVLLANEVESAARALEDPTPSRVKGVIFRVVQDNFEIGNLDASGFTLNDLARIREAFVGLLSGAFHGRTGSARG